MILLIQQWHMITFRRLAEDLCGHALVLITILTTTMHLVAKSCLIALGQVVHELRILTLVKQNDTLPVPIMLWEFL